MGSDTGPIGTREFLLAMNKIEQELTKLSTSFEHHVRHHEQRNNRTWQVLAPLLVASLIGIFSLVYKSHADQVTATLNSLCERVGYANVNQRSPSNTRLSAPRPSAPNLLSTGRDDTVAPDNPESRGWPD